MKQLLLVWTLIYFQTLYGQDLAAKLSNRTYVTSPGAGTVLNKMMWDDTSFVLGTPTYSMYYFSDESSSITVHSNGIISFNSKSSQTNKGTINIWGANLCKHKTLSSNIRMVISKNPGSSDYDLLTIIWENAGFADDLVGNAFINFSVTLDTKASNGYKTYIDVGSYANINNAWFTGGAPGIRLTNPNATDSYQLSNTDTNYTFTKNSSSPLFLSGMPASNTRLSVYNPIQVMDNRNYTLSTDIDYPVLWVNNTGKKVNVQYSGDDGKTWSTIASGLDSNYVYNYEYWNVPNQFYGRFLFRVVTIDGVTSGISLHYTTLYSYGPSQSLSVIAPNSGEVYQAGKKIPVRWNSTNVPLIRIGLYDPVIQSNIAYFGEFKSNNGANTDSITLPEGLDIDRVHLEIWGTFSAVSAQSPVPMARSANFFSITAQPVYVLLKTPETYTEYAIGNTVPLAYTTLGVRKVKLQYSSLKAGGWKVIFDSMPPTGSYNWTVPDDANPTSRLKIMSVDDTTVYSLSLAEFAISQSRLLLKTPVGGQKYTGGNKVNISWTQFGVRKLKIEYTKDGSSWQTITDSTISTSPYVWTLPNDSIPHCIVRITDIDYPATTAITESFEILYKSTTGIAEAGVEMLITCWPNPAHDHVVVSAPFQLENIAFFDVLGNRLLNITPDPAKQQSIDISTLSPGMYFMEIHTNNTNVRKQIIKY